MKTPRSRAIKALEEIRAGKASGSDPLLLQWKDDPGWSGASEAFSRLGPRDVHQGAAIVPAPPGTLMPPL
jgi:hypothetical protein